MGGGRRETGRRDLRRLRDCEWRFACCLIEREMGRGRSGGRPGMALSGWVEEGGDGVYWSES